MSLYHRLQQKIYTIWRTRRFKLFVDILQPAQTDVLLDVGGMPAFWTSQPQLVRQIDTLNVFDVGWDASSAPNHNIRAIVGDGCNLGMPANSYDIVFSNSVIEHVGTFDQQVKFASEVRRVGKSLWVQTPAYECPIEPHYYAPFVHYLPRWLQKRTLRWFTVWGWTDRPSQKQIDFMVDTTRLLKKSEMERLFPDCEITTERLLGFIPKSYIAIRRPAGQTARAR
jgi:Methyltransferase domain